MEMSAEQQDESLRTRAYLMTVLWVGTSVKASRSVPPRLEVLLVPFLPS